MHESFLGVACGAGFILSQAAAAFPCASLLGSEMSSSALNFVSSRLTSMGFAQMDTRHIPYIDEFGAIGAFEVIEHIEAYTNVLEQIYACLNLGSCC